MGKISQYAVLTAPAAGDLLLAVDVSDTSMAPSGTDKQVTAAVMFCAPAAATPVAGYTLVNGTGNILTWTAPNDGLLHQVTVAASLSVTSNQTGGQVTFTYTFPDSNSHVPTVFAGGAAIGGFVTNAVMYMVKAGSTVTLAQSSALTGGAAVLWAQLWAA